MLVDGFVGCSYRCAHARHAPNGKVLVVRFGGVSFLVIVVITVIADKADINRGEKRENDGLDQADEQLHEIENEQEAGAMEEILATKDIAEETNGESEGTDENGENFNAAHDQKDQGENRIEPTWGFRFIGFVAEKIPENEFWPGIFEDDDKPSAEGDQGECQRTVEI